MEERIKELARQLLILQEQVKLLRYQVDELIKAVGL